MIPVRARLGTGEVAAIFGVSRGWVAREAKAGRLPCAFVAGRYRFTPDDVTAIAASCRRGQDPPKSRVVWGDPPADAALAVPTRRRPPLDIRKWAHV